jgi:23S rRNA (guanosine2251-2'-O)-methyltransferase
LQQKQARVYVLSSHAKNNLFELDDKQPRVFVLGNETDGVSPDIIRLADDSVSIPMANGVESLNVAVTAALLSYFS